MCKVFAITNMKQVKLTPKLINAVKNEVCKSDNHGFGYAALTTDNRLVGERTLSPTRFTPMMNSKDSVTDKLPFVAKSSNFFGNVHTTTEIKSFIGHGRFSTNTVSLPNTHPFVGNGLALIHNGVVYDTGSDAPKTKTDNDTELLFERWKQNGMKSVEENISGYYALAILDTKGKLHIVRDDKASLYMSYCRTIHSYIVATTPEIIKGVAKRMKWKIEQPESILDNTYIVFDGNEFTHSSISPKRAVYSQAFNEQANAAFGVRDYDDYRDASGYTQAELDHFAGKSTKPNYAKLFQSVNDTESVTNDELFDKALRDEYDDMLFEQQRLANGDAPIVNDDSPTYDDEDNLISKIDISRMKRKVRIG